MTLETISSTTIGLNTGHEECHRFHDAFLLDLTGILRYYAFILQENMSTAVMTTFVYAEVNTQYSITSALNKGDTLGMYGIAARSPRRGVPGAMVQIWHMCHIPVLTPGTPEKTAGSPRCV